MGEKYKIGKLRAGNVAIGDHATAEYTRHADPERAEIQAQALYQIRQLIELMAIHSEEINGPDAALADAESIEKCSPREKPQPFPHREPHRQYRACCRRSDGPREGDRCHTRNGQSSLTVMAPMPFAAPTSGRQASTVRCQHGRPAACFTRHRRERCPPRTALCPGCPERVSRPIGRVLSLFRDLVALPCDTG